MSQARKIELLRILKDNRAFKLMRQFPNVAGPDMFAQAFPPRLGDLALRQSVFAAEPLDQRLGKSDDVLRAGAQRPLNCSIF